MKRLHVTILAFFAAVFLLPLNAYAQCNPGGPCLPNTGGYAPGSGANNAYIGPDPLDAPACDADFLNQIYARAFMEAERENVLAQTYIRKPDSVMEYTCMDRMISQVTPDAVSLFSENTSWQSKTIPLYHAFTAAGDSPTVTLVVNPNIGGSNTINQPLTDVVMRSLATFVNGSYNHDFLGGTAGIGSSISGGVSGGAYSCGAMLAVWDIAKCQNFPAAADTFWTFAELAAGDPRQFPTACGGTQIIPAMIATSRNAGPAYANAVHDPLDPLLQFTLPAVSNADCQPPVETGLQVTIYDSNFGAATATNPSGITRNQITIPEKVCLNPGCYYHVDITWGSAGPPPTPPSVTNEECRDG